MKFFAVRIQPDVRKNKSDRYMVYPSPKEYEHIWISGKQDGFHECVNFRGKGGIIKGYVPPTGAKLPQNELFGIIYVTSKSNEKEACACGLHDVILGIQIGCKFVGESIRDDVEDELKKYLAKNDSNLVYHYTVPHQNCILLKNPVSDASETIFPKITQKGYVWGPGAVREIGGRLFEILKAIENDLDPSQLKLWDSIKSKIDFVADSNYEPLHDEILNSDQGEYYEGDYKSVKVNRYERDPKIKGKVIESYNDNDVDPRNGYKCHVCGFDFEDAYGALGRDFIEVHHLVPLSKRKGKHKVNPAEDLVPLCANCHAMIHRMDDPDYDELRKMYRMHCYDKNRLNAAIKASRVISASDEWYICVHLSNLYDKYELEADSKKKAKLAKEIKEWIPRLPKFQLKRMKLGEIVKKFS